MATKMEMSLEDIITQTKGSRRGRGGRGGGGGGARGRGGAPRRGSRGGGGGGLRTGGPGIGRRPANRSSFGRSRGADGVWAHDKFQDTGFGGARKSGGNARVSGGGGSGAKITVSNLHFGVSDADIVELFGEIGNIRYASVHYDRSGRSMGKADVVFDRRADAQLAIQQYNGVPLDGRAMAITWANPPPAASPRTAIRQVQGGRVDRRGGGGARGGFRGGRGGRGGRGRGAAGGGGKKTTPPTAAELDAELDAYVSQNPK